MVSEMIGEFWNASGDSETTLLSSPASIFASHSRSSRKNGERDVQVLLLYGGRHFHGASIPHAGRTTTGSRR
jgi:hypothetical protein